MQLRHLMIPLLAAAFVPLLAFALWAQPDNTAKPAGAAAAEKKSPTRQLELDDKQRALASRYQRFEKTMLQMAEYLRKTDPERADLLIRAISKSKGTRITQQMVKISELLNDSTPQFGDALSRQEVVVGHLKAILQLLQSEDQRERNKKEQARIKDIIKDLKKLLGKEKDVRAGTERGDDANPRPDGHGPAGSRHLRVTLDSLDRGRWPYQTEGREVHVGRCARGSGW